MPNNNNQNPRQAGQENQEFNKGTQGQQPGRSQDREIDTEEGSDLGSTSQRSQQGQGSSAQQGQKNQQR